MTRGSSCKAKIYQPICTLLSKLTNIESDNHGYVQWYLAHVVVPDAIGMEISTRTVLAQETGSISRHRRPFRGSMGLYERRTHTYTYCENARTHKVDLESPKRVSEAKCCDKVVSEFVPRDRLKKPLSWRVSLFNLLGPVSRGESRSNGAKRGDSDECTYTKTTERLA